MMRMMLSSLTKLGHGWSTFSSVSKALTQPQAPSRALHLEEFQKLDQHLSRMAHESVKLRRQIIESPMEGKTLDRKSLEELERRIQKNQEKIFQLKLHLRVAASRTKGVEESQIIH